MSIKHPRQQAGYDVEELYFERLNRELIKKIKQEHGVEEPHEPTLASVIQLKPRNRLSAVSQTKQQSADSTKKAA